MQTKADLVAIVAAAPAMLDIGVSHTDEIVAALTQLIDYDLWTLEEYLAFMQKGDDAQTAARWTVFGIVKDLDFWAERGITTASQMGVMLDGECRKEARKEAMYDH